MPAVLYGWEIDEACLPPFQWVLPSKGGVTEFDANLDDDMIEILAQKPKLERVATYRQLQGHPNLVTRLLSNLLHPLEAPLTVYL